MINHEKMTSCLKSSGYSYNSSMHYFYKRLDDLDVTVYIDITYWQQLTGNSIFDKMNHGIESTYSYITTSTLKNIQEALELVDSDYEYMIKTSKEE